MLVINRPFIRISSIIYIHLTKKIHSLSSVDIQNLINIRKMEAARIARKDPVVMKLDSPVFQSIFSKNLTDLAELFKRHNFEIRIAGGAVRDLLLDKKPTDIDFATTATPVEMKEMFTKENVRMINMNGEKHGTITPRINNDENFEVTTLRIDLVTDGRHAEVQYTTDWQLDANRRDLTINSMFLGLDGCVYDYFYGHDDLMARRIGFVGDAGTRIQEDYLRILRYFRFYGRIANDANKHEEQTLKAIEANINGLQRISGERIWSELKKILQGNYACDLVCTLLNCGAAKYIGLPDSPNIENFSAVCKLSDCFEKPLQPISLLCGFLTTSDEVLTLHQRLKLTAYERDLALYLVQNCAAARDKDDLKTYHSMCLLTSQSPKLVVQQCLELLKFIGKTDLHSKLSVWEIPRFPVSSEMLHSNGCPRGRLFGQIVQKLKRKWIASDFQLDADGLLELLPTLVEEFSVENQQTSDNNKISLNKKQKVK